MRRLSDGNKKALREQGQILPTTPTKALKEVGGEYTPFADIAINGVQFVEREPVHARLWVGQARDTRDGVRVAIGGRDGRAELFLKSADEVDALINRLNQLRMMQFNSCEVVK